VPRDAGLIRIPNRSEQRRALRAAAVIATVGAPERKETTMGSPVAKAADRKEALRYDGTVVATVYVEDFAGSMAWYGDVLGFDAGFRLDDYRWGEVATPVRGATIGVNGAAAPNGGATLVFGVHDIDAARLYLESRDVRFEGETVELPGMVKLATFFDPEGNRLMLAQNLAPDA
jgi:CreA protein